MKFKYILESAGAIDWMALLPLILFFIIFGFITIYALRQSKQYVNKMANLPLEDTNPETPNIK